MDKHPLNKVIHPIDISQDLYTFLDKYKEYTTNSISERLLQSFIAENPYHNDYNAVLIKTTLLNVFYSTGIQAIELMTKNIYSIENIDEILAQDTYSADLVNRIALLKFGEGKKDRNNYSFATKYCALHQPNKYPIYDSIVANFLTGLMQHNGLFPFYSLKLNQKEPSTLSLMTKREFERALRNYDFFVRVYDQFMGLYGLKKDDITYREVDWYIWASYKAKGYTSKLEEMVQLSDVYEWEDNKKDFKRTRITQYEQPGEAKLLKILQNRWKN